MRSIKNLFQKQVSLLFSLKLQTYCGEKASQLTVEQSHCISLFYEAARRPDLASEALIRSFFSNGYSFWAIWEDNRIVSGIWAFNGDIALKNPSFIVLAKKIGNSIRLNSDCIYIGYIYTLEDYRGKGYCETIARTIFDYYFKNDYRTCILTTGPENMGMIKTVAKFEHQIEGIFEIYKVLRLYKQRTVFRSTNNFYYKV